jgi:4-amino-4-deoxy-L-arabinose transferase-like glycosyltransferase
MRLRTLLPWALAALLALTLFPGLSRIDALDEREARDLVTAYESTHRREWLAPILGNEPHFEKPLPGLAPEAFVRLMIARHVPEWNTSTMRVGVSRALRALLAVALALSVAGTGGILFGARTGWLAAIALTTMLGLPLAARTDGVQLYATLLAWLGIGRMLVVLAARSRGPGLSLSLGWLALGAAALAGGPLPALWAVAGFALYFTLARHHRGWRALQPGAGVLFLLGATLPWYGLVAAFHGWPFLREAFFFPYAMQEPGAFLSGVPLTLSFAVVCSFPWSPLLAAALADTAARLRRAADHVTPPLPLDTEHLEHLLTALAVAGLLPIVFYPSPPLTAALPALPAAALLIGRFIDRVLSGDGESRGLTHATRLLAVTGTAVAACALVVATRLPEAAGPLRLLATVLFVTSWGPLLADLRRARRTAVALFALPAALAAPIVHLSLLPALEPWLNARATAETMERVSPQRAPLVVFEPPPASLRQALQRNLILSTSLLEHTADAVARDGYVYAAFRPLREPGARAVLASIAGEPEVLARTPVLVLVRAPVRPGLTP